MSSRVSISWISLPDVFDMSYTESREEKGRGLDLKIHRPHDCLKMLIFLSNKNSVIEHSSEFDYRSLVNRTSDYVRLAKFYCEFD